MYMYVPNNCWVIPVEIESPVLHCQTKGSPRLGLVWPLQVTLIPCTHPSPCLQVYCLFGCLVSLFAVVFQRYSSECKISLFPAPIRSTCKNARLHRSLSKIHYTRCYIITFETKIKYYVQIYRYIIIYIYLVSTGTQFFQHLHVHSQFAHL